MVEGYWFSMLKVSMMSRVGGNNGALRARAFGGHEDADVDVEQIGRRWKLPDKSVVE